MQSIAYIPGSDGVANASLMTISTVRAPLASTILVNTVANVPDKFYGSMGTPNTFTDPITGETITVISEATAVDFAGHVDGSNIEIDEIAPGYTDNGSAVGDIIIIRPVTEWANNIHNVLSQSLDDDGTIKDNAINDEAMFADSVDPVKRSDESEFDYIASGCVWSADAVGSTRLASCTAGVVYINGKRLTVAAVTGRTFTASKDVYCDLKDNGDGTAVWVYYDNTTNAVSPTYATTTGQFRGAIIVVGASNIASVNKVNQGQITADAPVVSGNTLTVSDTEGYLIGNRAAYPSLICYRRTGAQAGITGTFALGGSLGYARIPEGRSIEAKVYSRTSGTDQSTAGAIIRQDGVALSYEASVTYAQSGRGTSLQWSDPQTPTSGKHSYDYTYRLAAGAGSVTHEQGWIGIYLT